MPFQKGTSGNKGGRPKGSPNKTTAVVKEGILCAYHGIGGDKAFQSWAQANPTDFYTKILVKVLPAELHHAGPDGEALKVPQALTFVIQQQPDSDNRT